MLTRDYQVGDIVKNDKSIDIYLGETYSLFDFSYSLSSNGRDHIINITRLDKPSKKYAYQYIGKDTLTIKNGWINIRDSKQLREVSDHSSINENYTDALIRNYYQNQINNLILKGMAQLAVDNLIRKYQYSSLGYQSYIEDEYSTYVDKVINSLKEELDKLHQYIGYWYIEER